jgi:Holliday junction resolvase RusA-like endonuclease
MAQAARDTGATTHPAEAKTMMTNIAFTVPGDPQGKGRAKVVKIGGFTRMATPQKTVAYEGLIALAAKQAMAGPPWDGACVIEVDAVFAMPKSMPKKHRADALAGKMRPTKKPDGDNVLKAVCDGINGVVWADDVQAVDQRVTKRYGETPGLFVRVSRL